MEQHKRMAKYFFLPLVILLGLYWAVMSMVNIHYGQPVLSIETEVKYIVSVLWNTLDVDFFSFDIPAEYADYIYHRGYPHPMISIRLYHFLLDKLPYPMAYQWFVYYLPFALASAVLFLALSPKISEEKKLKKDKYIRGTKKVSAPEFCRESQKIRDAGIYLPTRNGGKLLLSHQKEKEHFVILGSTGSGKSTLLLAMAKEFVRRKTKMIFIDRKGEFWSHFGDEKKDVLFNPFDARSVRWNIFNEINFELNEAGTMDKISPDLQIIADLLCGVNDIKNADNKYWYISAASVFGSAVCWCALNGKTTARELSEFLSSAPDQLIAAFQSLPKSLQVGLRALGTKEDANQIGQIMSMVSSCSHQLSCFIGKDGDWSVRDWINNGEGNLYISTAGKNDTSFLSVVTLLIDLIGREIKGFPDDGGQDTKIVFVIDELGALPPLETLTFLLTQARSKGVAVILANQTFERLLEVYGQHGAKNIMACAKSKFFFQMPEATDAGYLGKTLGQAEVERTMKNKNESSGALLSSGQNRKGESINHSIVKDDAFLPADISALQTGEAVVILPNLLPMVSKIAFQKVDTPVIQVEFEPCPVYEVAARSIYQVIATEPVTDEEKIQEPVNLL